ncbi:MAG TPA: ThiF family adenylyltransferase [Blastocatellia bacterium]|nr:ThiF family adenylyltransferase [Blastocatellia bacterium]
MSFSERYSRQIIFPGIGESGQKALLNGRATIIGCGALGAMQAEMLARAGVGHLRIIDRDFVEFSNLQRQIMFTEQDAIDRLPKAIACEKRITSINSDISLEAIVADVNQSNIESFVAGSDVVLDGTDNFETRYLINDACVKNNVPWIYGAAVGAHGLTMTIRPRQTPCLRCVFEDAPAPGTFPTCDTGGIILPIIAQVTAVQVSEALKIITSQLDLLHNGLLQFDLWQYSQSRVKLDNAPNDDCPTCKRGEYPFLNAARVQSTTTLCGRNSVQINNSNGGKLDLSELANRLNTSGEVFFNKYLLRFKVGEYEMTIFPDARGIIKGTSDISVARSLYARYIGA